MSDPGGRVEPAGGRVEPAGGRVEPAGGQVSATGPKSEAGPLGRVDAASLERPGTVVRPSPARASLTIAAGFAGLIASLVVLGSIAEAVRLQEVFALDTWATPFLHAMRSPGMDALMGALTTIGSGLVIVPIFIVVVGWLIWRRRYGAAALLVVATTGSLVIQVTMKSFFARPRPPLPWAQVLPDYSFPSGHTLNAVTFYVAVALILWSVNGRRIGLGAVAISALIALGVGISRIYLGYHYLTDVVGGALAGTAWLLVVGAAFRARPTWWGWGGGSVPRGPQPEGPGVAAVGR